MSDINEILAKLHETSTVQAGLLTELRTVLDAPPPKPEVKKQVDWEATGVATQTYFDRTRNWEQVTIYTDGTREGPELPEVPTTTPPVVQDPPVVVAPPPTKDPVPNGAILWSGSENLSHRYGHTWDHDGILTVSSWAGEGWQPSGAMQPPHKGGNGYGVYTMELDGSKTNAPGKFACLWPEPDKWYWEIDIVENDFNGEAVATLHWGAVNADGTDGKDQSTFQMLKGIRADERHVYETTWSRDLIIIKVDGVEKARFTENVPRDASDGGCNALMGVGTQPAWAPQAQTGDQAFNLYSCSYRKL